MGEHRPPPPSCFLIIYNVSKKHNIGTLARSAVAFGVQELCLVGSARYNTFGNHGAIDYIPLKHFHNIQECCVYLRESHGCEIVGIEIEDGAISVDKEPFNGPTAFMVGNEGTGLSKEQKQQCTKFIYIPQFGNGTASLNVTVACSIILHRFTSWAQYQESPHQHGKYLVADKPLRRHPRGVAPSHQTGQ